MNSESDCALMKRISCGYDHRDRLGVKYQLNTQRTQDVLLLVSLKHGCSTAADSAGPQ